LSGLTVTEPNNLSPAVTAALEVAVITPDERATPLIPVGNVEAAAQTSAPAPPEPSLSASVFELSNGSEVCAIENLTVSDPAAIAVAVTVTVVVAVPPTATEADAEPRATAEVAVLVANAGTADKSPNPSEATATADTFFNEIVFTIFLSFSRTWAFPACGWCEFGTIISNELPSAHSA
jgi:hypothetical protein